MGHRPENPERSLRDYPISLRQSARAVFGIVYELAEKQTARAGSKEHREGGQ